MKQLIMIFMCTALMLSADTNGIPLLRWAGPEGSRPGTYEEWYATHPEQPFEYTLRSIRHGLRDGTVAIFTDQNLVTALNSQLTQLETDLCTDGYTVVSYGLTGGTPEDLKTMLADLYDTLDLEGALLVGSLPVAWYEVQNDFNSYGYADFPCDLFFMDLDGTWLDTMNTGNGKYDGHDGDMEPEIYVGRLYPDGLGDDTLLLQNYFVKNNAYRQNALHLTDRALVFVDDDWYPWANQWANDVGLLYSDIMQFSHPETTRAEVYRPRLDTTQAWVAVFAHSWPQGHQFSYNGGASHDYYYGAEYTTQDPPSNFYNFFACSFSRFTESSNCGGARAVFNQSYGLASLGSTKTGSMLDFGYFYQPLGDSANLGEAFRDWFIHITGNGVTHDELCWHYGMTLLGDPFLNPTGHEVGIAEFDPVTTAGSALTVLSNPVGASMRAALSLPASEHVTVALYDCTGRRVTVFLNGVLDAGDHAYSWNMTDRHGTALPTGAYILRAKFATRIISKKIVKL
jgi:hypothetical protein